jgi:hypothetical protein
MVDDSAIATPCLSTLFIRGLYRYGLTGYRVIGFPLFDFNTHS